MTLRYHGNKVIKLEITSHRKVILSHVQHAKLHIGIVANIQLEKEYFNVYGLAPIISIVSALS